MLITKPTVTGIDIYIQRMQTFLYPKVKTLWGLTDTTYTSYGRAYRNQTKDGYSPEVYTGGNEYKDVYFDDTVFASSFFGVGETTEIKNKTGVTADVFLIFMVDLNKIKPGTTRNDEECHIDIEKMLIALLFGFTCTGIVTGIDQVFKEYTGWRKQKGLMYRDMQPLHCFRLNFKLLYNPFLTCQT